MKFILSILASAFGGTCSSLITLASSLVSGGSLPELSYILGILIFGFLGASICLIFREEDPKKAFFLGIGVPALIQASVSSASSPINPEPYFNIGSSIISPALAEETLPNSSNYYFSQVPLAEKLKKSQNQLKKITVDSRECLELERFNSNADCFIYFTSKDKEQIFGKKLTQNQQEVEVPDFADYVYVQSGKVSSPGVSLVNYEPNYEPSESIDVLKIDVTKNSWTGLQQSLGYNQASQYNIELSAQELKNLH